MQTRTLTLSGLYTKYLLLVPVTIFGLSILSSLLLGYNALSENLYKVIFIMWAAFGAFDLSAILNVRKLRKNRNQQIKAILLPSEISTDGDIVPSPLLNLFESTRSARRVVARLGTTKWQLADYEINAIRQRKNGSYTESRTAYISVVQIPLPRALPHVVFDSTETSGKQMRFSFDSNQKISLEGNFDEYFDTYYPAHYHIDLLSIVTPEVMQSLLEAKAYDIEIYGNTLNIYGPLSNPAATRKLIDHGLSIADKLQNNIITYSDPRLTTPDRETVHAYGRTIQENYMTTAWVYAFIGAVLVLISAAIIYPAIIGILDTGELMAALMFFFLIFGSGVLVLKSSFAIYKSGQEERRIRAAFNKRSS
jgi:hypothetical protein